MRYTRAVTYVLLAACMAGCQPAPTPTPSSPSVVATGPDIEPTYECTPEFPSPSPSPRPTTCSKDAYDRMKARDTQYAEAERIYRQFHDIDARLAQGDMSAGDELDHVATAETKDQVLRVYRKDRSDGISLQGESKLIWINRFRDVKPTSLLALEGCIDSSGAKIIRQDREIGSGGYLREVVDLKLVSGKPVIWHVRSALQDSCG